MATISHKLRTPLEGALAGGGDPATSPLYVFGPFLTLLLASQADPSCFGAALWLVVLTVVVVSGMYRLVMRWVSDGSGGSGLSEEEFGSWAVRLNAAITIIDIPSPFSSAWPLWSPSSPTACRRWSNRWPVCCRCALWWP